MTDITQGNMDELEASEKISVNDAGVKPRDCDR